jgi:hypothetical protein
MAGLGSTTTKRAREMRGVLDRWARSGLTQREFGDREGMAASTIAWWGHVFRHAGKPRNRSPKHQRRRRRSRQGAAPAFIEVKLEAVTPAQAAPLEIVVRSGQVIRVPPQFDASSLRAVVAALESPC